MLIHTGPSADWRAIAPAAKVCAGPGDSTTLHQILAAPLHGTPAGRLAVEIWGDSETGFADMVEGLKFSETGAPRLVMSTDGIPHRAGERVPLTIQGKNEQRPWVIDTYLILEGPRGALWFHNGQRLVAYRPDRWTPLGVGTELPAGARPAGVLGVPLAGLAPGDYTWYLLVAERGSRRIIADARARMEVVP